MPGVDGKAAIITGACRMYSSGMSEYVMVLKK